MLLTLTTTHRPATDLGYLLHKNPDRVHEMPLSFGTALLFFAEAGETRATAVLALDVDPVALVRGKGRTGAGRDGGGLLDQYVNDRPYAASSFLSVAIAKTLRNALGGSSKERPELAATAIPLVARVTPLPIRGSEGLLERLFAPLGYELAIETIPLDETWPEWGPSPYVTLTLAATCRLADLLSHLYVLIPVLDKQKHYFVEKGEIEKLLAKGAGWLARHPERDLIVTRYLRFKRSLTRAAMARLDEDAGAAATGDVEVDADAGLAAAVASAVPELAAAARAAAPDEGAEPHVPESRKDTAELALETPLRLHDRRLDAVAAVLKASGARRVVDLGCGSGKLLKRLMAERQFTEILGMDVSSISLAQAERRLRLDRLPERQKARIRLVQGALTYRDRRIEGFDAVALVEVIEHLDPDRLASAERSVFEHARPGLVVLTTPNREYNQLFEGMAPGQMRHADHRFEWTRAELDAWARPVAERHGYSVRIEGIGDADPALGAPSQMAVFERS